MLNIGPAELLVVMVVALLVLGPTKLPDAARQVGRALGEMRRLSSGFQSEMRDALKEPVDSVATKAATSSATSPTRTPTAGIGGALAAPRPPAGEVEPDAAEPDVAKDDDVAKDELASPAETPSALTSEDPAPDDPTPAADDVEKIGTAAVTDEPAEPGTHGATAT